MIRTFTLTLAFFLILILGSCKKNETDANPPGPVWISFTKGNSPILSNRVSALLAASDGYVWIATDQGVSGYSKGSWTAITDSLAFLVYSSAGPAVSHEVNALAEGRDGSLWFGLNGGGVRRYNKTGSTIQAWFEYHTPNVPSEFITAIGCVRILSPGDVWFASTSGITLFEPSVVNPELGGGTWAPSSNFTPYLPQPEVYTIITDNYNSEVMFGTFDGLAIFNNGTNSWSTTSPKLSSPIVSLAYDNAGVIWMAQWAGVSTHNLGNQNLDQSFTSASTNGKLPVGTVNAVASDLRSTRWFGTSYGLARLHDTTWSTFTHATTSSIPNDTITALTYDLLGNLWVGTTGGIAVYNQNGTQF